MRDLAAALSPRRPLTRARVLSRSRMNITIAEVATILNTSAALELDSSWRRVRRRAPA